MIRFMTGKVEAFDEYFGYGQKEWWELLWSII